MRTTTTWRCSRSDIKELSILVLELAIPLCQLWRDYVYTLVRELDRPPTRFASAGQAATLAEYLEFWRNQEAAIVARIKVLRDEEAAEEIAEAPALAPTPSGRANRAAKSPAAPKSVATGMQLKSPARSPVRTRARTPRAVK